MRRKINKIITNFYKSRMHTIELILKLKKYAYNLTDLNGKVINLEYKKLES